jgi:photosystem II stability/assembly factor-like uncharacterized protein
MAIGAPDLKNVKIDDLTFAEGEGWGLATADCTDGSGSRCTALLHTADGTTWKSVPTSGLSGRGAVNIRFANKQDGYAFGPHVFLTTDDGGANWTQQPGGAIALETLDQNVIRVTSSGPGCPSWCDVQVETSDIGSTSWTKAELGPTPGYGLQLARGHSNAYLLFPGHVSGGAETATSALYRSLDDGRTWKQSGEPCPQKSAEIDSTAIAAGGDTVSVLCATRQAPHRVQVATSTDAGAEFTAQPGEVPEATAELLAGDPTTELVAAGDGMSRSTDGGQTWQPVPDVTGHVTWLGFESNTDGRAVTDHRIIWTTEDGGVTWTPVAFN